MLSAFLAEAQSSNGVDHRYPMSLGCILDGKIKKSAPGEVGVHLIISDSSRLTLRWLLFAFYTAISCIGLLAWCVILKRGIGLRCMEDMEDDKPDDLEAVSAVSSVSNEETLKELSHSRCYSGKMFQAAVQDSLQSFACPWSLVLPVIMATLTQITQWSIVGSIGEIGAEMCDAESCSGKTGRWVFRLSLTLSQIFVPLGSVVSSLGTCPRRIFYILCLLQYLTCFVICAATAGAWRSLFTSEAGQALFISSYALCGMLEGYVITMCYRYIGDAESIPLAKRHSAGALLSIATVILVSSCSVVLGAAVSDKQIACIDPA